MFTQIFSNKFYWLKYKNLIKNEFYKINLKTN